MVTVCDKEVLARTAVPTGGRSHVTEFTPATGQVRAWEETYDHSGAVHRVHPKMKKPARSGTATNRRANSGNWGAASPYSAGTATPWLGKAAPRRPMARAAKPSTTSTNPAPSSPWHRSCATNRCACWPNRVTPVPTTSTRTRYGPTPRKRCRLTYWPGTSATTWARHKN